MSEIFPPNTDPQLLEDVAELLHRVARRVRQRANEHLGPLGLTPAQARALRTLDRCGEPIRMSELADRLRIARRSATSVVDVLATAGLVERRVDPSDRRATTVTVTRRGAGVLARLAQLRPAALTELAAGVPAGDLAALRTTLAQLDRPDTSSPAVSA